MQAVIEFITFLKQTLQTMKNFQEALQAGLIPALDYIISDERVPRSTKLAAVEHKHAAEIAENVKYSVVQLEGVMPFEKRPAKTQEALSMVSKREQAAWDWLGDFVRNRPVID